MSVIGLQAFFLGGYRSNLHIYFCLRYSFCSVQASYTPERNLQDDTQKTKTNRCNTMAFKRSPKCTKVSLNFPGCKSCSNYCEVTPLFAYIFHLQLSIFLDNKKSCRQCIHMHVCSCLFFSIFLSKYTFIYMASYMFICAYTYICPVCVEVNLLVIKGKTANICANSLIWGCVLNLLATCMIKLWQ